MTTKILIVRLKSLGDILLSTVVARELIRFRSDAAPDDPVHVDYLIDEAYAGATRAFPFIRAEHLRPRSWLARLRQMISLRRRYDGVLDMHGSVASATLASIASAPNGIVVGYESKRLSFLYDVRVDNGKPSDHTVEVNLKFLEAFEGFEGMASPLPASVSIRADVDESLRRKNSVLIHPGGRFPHKIWPADRFRMIADKLTAAGHHVSILIGPGDPEAMELAGYDRVENVNPSELISTFGRFDIFIGNDSGPMHFAAAAGCRVVGLFGPSDPARWRPYSDRSVVVSAPCACGRGRQRPCKDPEQWCMNKIGVDDVMKAILE